VSELANKLRSKSLLGERESVTFRIELFSLVLCNVLSNLITLLEQVGVQHVLVLLQRFLCL